MQGNEFSIEKTQFAILQIASLERKKVILHKGNGNASE
jgi:hypothetical protein